MTYNHANITKYLVQTKILVIKFKKEKIFMEYTQKQNPIIIKSDIIGLVFFCY